MTLGDFFTSIQQAVDWATDTSIALSVMSQVDLYFLWLDYVAMRLRWTSKRFLKIPILEQRGIHHKVQSQRWNRYRMVTR